MIEVKPKEGIFKKVVGILPQLSIAILLLGLIKQILYYKNFNVPIKYFIGLSELGLVVSDDLLVILPVLGFSMVVLFLFTVNFFPMSDVLEVKKGAGKENLIPTIVGAVILTILVVMIIAFPSQKHYYTKLSVAVLIVLLAFIIVMLFFKDKIKKHAPAIRSFEPLFFAVIILSFIINYISQEIQKVEKGKYIGTIIKTADSTYISTDSSYFIGKTEKYVFIYNVKDTSTDIIPTESIIKMKLKLKY